MEFLHTPSGIDAADAEKVAHQLQERLDGLIDLALVLEHVH